MSRAVKETALVFVAAAALLALLNGNRFVLTGDEGILLQTAAQMARGQRLYVDFAGYMSPGSYWVQAALFRWLGMSLWVGRILVTFDLALQCALLFWLTARLASRRAACAVVVIFFGFQIADPSFLTGQHRWDSATLALAGLCLALSFAERKSGWTIAASGALLAAAAWCTPSVALAGVAEAAWLAAARERRKALVPFAGGILAVTLAAAGWLAIQGSLAAFLRQMLFLKGNYAAVNRMPYGAVIGGYGRLLAGSAGLEKFLRLILVACLALPAALPPLAGLLWSWAFLRNRIPPALRSSIALLLAGAAALVASAWPRADLFHLNFVAAVSYALVAVALARLLSLRAGAVVAFTMLPLAAVFAWNDIADSWSARAVPSPVGTIRVAPNLAPELEKLLATVRPRQTLFVYPYLPAGYFLTQTANPARFISYNPAMMSAEDETSTLGDLQSRPPQWVLYLPLGREEFLRVFPNAAGLHWRFEKLEAWLQNNYRPVEQPPVELGGYRLWQRIESADRDALTLGLR